MSSVDFVNRIGTQVISLEKLVDNFRLCKRTEPQCVEVSVRRYAKPLFRELGTVDLSIEGDAKITADPSSVQSVSESVEKQSGSWRIQNPHHSR